MRWARCWSVGLLGLCASVATAAVRVDTSGRGQVLLVPYYEAGPGVQSLLTVVNPTPSGKALKLRIREPVAGRETYALNLYLAPHDTWTAAPYTESASETARLISADQSCTVPTIRATADPALRQLRMDQYTGALALGPATVERTWTGMLEVFEMGELDPTHPLAQAATQIDGRPADCAALSAAWTPDGVWKADPQAGLRAPGGGLSASLQVVHENEGRAYPVPITALAGFSVVVQHSAPDGATPDLASVRTRLAHDAVDSAIQIDGVWIQSQWKPERAIDAVSAAMMTSEIQNQFDSTYEIRAVSEWITVFPSKRHYTDPILNDTSSPLPFGMLNSLVGGHACDLTQPVGYDRHARRPIGFVDFLGVPRPCVCLAMEVTAINSPPAALSACPAISTVYGVSSNGYFANGWIQIPMARTPRSLGPSLDGKTLHGLPVIGFWRLRYQDAAAADGGVRTYALTTPHTSVPICTDAAGVACRVEPAP